MLDLIKEAEKLEDYIKNTMKPDDRQIEVDAYHAKEMLERAITAEKAVELLTNLAGNPKVECLFGSGKCKKIEELNYPVGFQEVCEQCLYDWAMRKARE